MCASTHECACVCTCGLGLHVVQVSALEADLGYEGQSTVDLPPPASACVVEREWAVICVWMCVVWVCVSMWVCISSRKRDTYRHLFISIHSPSTLSLSLLVYLLLQMLYRSRTHQSSSLQYTTPHHTTLHFTDPPHQLLYHSGTDQWNIRACHPRCLCTQAYVCVCPQYAHTSRQSTKLCITPPCAHSHTLDAPKGLLSRNLSGYSTVMLDSHAAASASVCVWVCVCTCMSVSGCVWVWVWVCMCDRICVSTRMHRCEYVCICLSLSHTHTCRSSDFYIPYSSTLAPIAPFFVLPGCLCVYVCVYVCVCVCVRVCVCVCVCVSGLIGYTRICSHTCLYTHTHTYIHTHIYIYIYIYRHTTCIHTHVHIHTYTHTCT
jgi:hypothetical protein